MKIILMRQPCGDLYSKEHIGTRSFVHYREVPFIWKLKCNSIIGIGLSIIERCSLFGVSFIRGSTVYYYVHVPYYFVIGSIWELTCANGQTVP